MSAYKVSLALNLLYLLPLIVFSRPYPADGPAVVPRIQGFIENKGQILDQDQQPVAELLYLLRLDNGLNVQVKQRGFSYDTYREVKGKDALPDLAFHRLDITFPGSATYPQVTAAEALTEELQFSHPKQVRVRQFRKITYHHLYPHIDLEMIAAPGPGKPVEYNFILHPGARLSDIRIQYRGGSLESIEKDMLTFQLAHGCLTESIPASFWQQDGSKVAVQYELLDQQADVFTFGLSAPVDRVDQTLIIDPIPHLDWATYLGGNGDDNCRDMTMDVVGNSYLVGSSNSPNAIATTGTHQNILAGEKDVFIAKFNNEGVRLWSTYVGGPGDDEGQNIDIDAVGNIYITGATGSTDGMATPGTAQPNFAGGPTDAFAAKFDNDGIRIWGTYLGGPENDFANAVAVDALGNVFIAGWTNSTTGIATAGAFQTVFSQAQDAFLTKFDADGALVWSTYYGNTGLDIGLQLAASPTGDIWFSGWTSSTAGISLPGSHQPVHGGGTADAFLVQFSTDGLPQVASYYGGTGDDYGDALQLDADGNVYLGGPCTSPNAIATPGAYQDIIGGAFDSYLVKFNANGTRQWGTYYGGPQDEAAYGIALGPDEGIYLTGFTNSQTGIATADAHQTIFSGGDWDAFLVKFDQGAQVVWGTYYGGAEADQSFAVAVDANNKAFIAGVTSSAQNISTAGSHQEVFGGGNDAFLARFAPCSEPVLDVPNGGYLCSNEAFVLELNFTDAGPYTFTYAIDGVDQAPINLSGTSFLLSLDAGEYQDSVVITGVSSGECIGEITGLPFIKVAEPLTSDQLLVVCEDGTDNYTVEVTLSGGMFGYIPVDPNAGVVNGNQFTSRAYTATEVYSFQLTSGLGCDTLTFTGNGTCGAICADFSVSADAPSPICEGEAIQLSVDGGQTFSWTGPVGFNSIEQNPFIDNVGTAYSGTYQVIATNDIGCTDTATTVVEVLPPPRIQELLTTPLSCTDEFTDLTIMASGTGQLEYALDDSAFATNNVFDTLGVGSYDVYVRDEQGCITRQNLLIQREEGPIITAIGIESPSCGSVDGVIDITATGGEAPLRYAIDGGTNFQDSPLFEGLSGGDYAVLVVDAKGCSITAQATLASATEAPVINEIMIEQSACMANQNSVIVNAVSNSTELEYTLDGVNFQMGNRFSGLPAGTYTVTVRAAGGCSTTGTVVIPQIDVLRLNRVEIREADCLGNNGRIDIQTSGGNGTLTFTLNDTLGQGSGLFNELVPGTYRWTVTDGSGCSISDVATVSRGDCPIYIANVFSPNGDGVNDEFSLFAASGISGQVTTYEIFNRWGDLVFRSGGFSLDDDGQWWDGSLLGRPAEGGVYVYHIVIDLDGGEQLVENGEVILLR